MENPAPRRPIRRRIGLLSLAGLVALGALSGCLKQQQDLTLHYLNRDRRAHTMSSLHRSSAYSERAQDHAWQMATSGRLFHSTLRAGGSVCAMGENVAYAGSVGSAHRALMNSAGHRANILNPRYDTAGIGVIRHAGLYWVVQLFVDRC